LSLFLPENKEIQIKMTNNEDQTNNQLRAFEAQLGYRFSDINLLHKALVHSSYSFEQDQPFENNEILEFLGDAVLDLTVGVSLIQNFPEMAEGELTRMRASLVNENHLAGMARAIDLGKYLCLGKGEEASNGRNKPSILACAYEAVVGAVFQDGGYETAAAFADRQFAAVLSGAKEAMLQRDAKSRLQEKIQGMSNETPVYVVEREEGPAHDKRFTVSVRFHGETRGTGTAKSKKEAEQIAAAMALAEIQET